MTTSLAEQLKRLQTPQAALLIQSKRKPSLLFDTKEAANVDRETILNIGQNGLQELIKLCPLFEEFEESLFSSNSLRLERSVQDASFNERLNTTIEEFLVLLSPYFLLNTAHKALEWLIRRFHIHQFNKDAFLLLILPYHETRMFVRALQLVDVSSASDKWNWLEPLQKIGVPLSSLTLVSRISTDNGLLKLVCEHVIAATKTYGDQASNLSTLYSFFVTALTGCIDRTINISEIQVNHILPALTKGLSSSTTDFAASAYMILAYLVRKVELREETMEFLILKCLKRPTMQEEVIRLLLFLYENPFNRVKEVPESVMRKLSSISWFVEKVLKIKSGMKITKFIVALLKTAMRFIINNPEVEPIRQLVNDIFTKIPLEHQEVNAILKNTLTDEVVSKQNSIESREFLIDLYCALERRYPVVFDEFLKNLIDNQNETKSKQILQFLMTWYSEAREAEESLDILTSLNHYNPEQRILALKALGEGQMSVAENLKEMVKEALRARFADDDVRVVFTLLSLPKNLLRSMFSADTLVDELMILVSTCYIEGRMVLAKPALEILLDLCDESDDTNVFLVAVPYLFPSKEEDVDIALQVLKSDFAKRNAYMQKVNEEIQSLQKSADTLRSVAFHNILKPELLPCTQSILSAMKQQMVHGDAGSMFFNMIILGSVCRVPVGTLSPQVATEAIEMAAAMVERYPNVQPMKDTTHLNADKILAALNFASAGILPLQVNTYVLEMVHRRLNLNVDATFDFEDDPHRSNLVLRLLEVLFKGLNPEIPHVNQDDWRSHYEWCLKIFFQRHFSNVENTITFMSQLFVEPVSNQTAVHALSICLKLFDNCTAVNWVCNDVVFTSNLLLAYGSEENACRDIAARILQKLEGNFDKSDGFAMLIRELSKRDCEITTDGDQLQMYLYHLLSPDPDVNQELNSELRNKMAEARNMLFDAITSKKIPIHSGAQMLELLGLVNGTEILNRLIPFGLELLEKVKKDDKVYAGSALKNILQRFDSSTVAALRNEKTLRFFLDCITDYKTQITTKTGSQFISSIAIKLINESFFANIGQISEQLQRDIFGKLVDVVTDCEIDALVTPATRVVKKIEFDVKFVAEIIKNMTNIPEVKPKETKSKRRSRSTLSPEMINSRQWRRGVTTLEFVQNAYNICNDQLLIAPLFNLLRTCLNFEVQDPVEYTNQLILSTIHHLVNNKGLVIKDAHLYVDLIALCIRTSHNPQTHHHALLVLVELFKVADIQGALHNVMPIFTFMGSSVLRQDDAYSIQIISKTIETVVPIINTAKNEKHACEVLRLFVTSLPDIPEHRRIPLFTKLLQLMENYLHLFYLLSFESHVLSRSIEAPNQKLPSQRLEFALLISQEFSLLKLLQMCVKLVGFLRILPVDIEEDQKIEFAESHIFDVARNSPKQLRHYKYTVIQFLSGLLSSPDFINRVAELGEEEVGTLRIWYDKLIVELVLLIQSISKCADVHQGKPKGKYWKVLLHNVYDVLDLVNNLLLNHVFIASITRLLRHELLTVRRKALELLNARLQQRKFGEQDYEDLVLLIEPILNVLDGPTKFVNPELEVIQQTALISLKLLAKILTPDHVALFKPILDLTTELVKTREGAVLASAVLCLAELCSSMRIHAIQSLNKFVPAILRLLKNHCKTDTPDVLVISIVSALQKIVESVGNFLSMYLDQLLLELARLHSLYTDAENQKVAIVISRLRATTQKLSSCIPMRVLLPAVNKTYDALLKKKTYVCISPLMSVLADSFSSIPSADLNASIPDLATFFLKVLQFREEVDISEGDMDVDDEATMQDVAMVEEYAGKALVSLVLKLSEATFRPLYYKLYDWAARNPQHKQRNITFYRLSANIAECLKSLFVLFAGHFLKHAATLLSSNNVVQEETTEMALPDKSQQIELVEAILLTFTRVFSYDAHDFVNQERFEILMQPIVDQIENTMGSKKQFEKRAKNLIVPCVASFAGAIADDSLHKQLVYQVLLKTRHAKPYVRSAALSSLVEVARKLGEDFISLLPETVPFLAELLEDEDEAVEKYAQDAVRTLEEILGEPLQKYF